MVRIACKAHSEQDGSAALILDRNIRNVVIVADRYWCCRIYWNGSGVRMLVVNDALCSVKEPIVGIGVVHVSRQRYARQAQRDRDNYCHRHAYDQHVKRLQPLLVWLTRYYPYLKARPCMFFVPNKGCPRHFV